MTDMTAPATKQDIAMIMDEIGKLYMANEKWKEEILHEFTIRIENLRHDMIGTHKDKIEDHEDRLVRLERHAEFRKR